jgi:hypothetical protein
MAAESGDKDDGVNPKYTGQAWQAMGSKLTLMTRRRMYNHFRQQGQAEATTEKVTVAVLVDDVQRSKHQRNGREQQEGRFPVRRNDRERKLPRDGRRSPGNF